MHPPSMKPFDIGILDMGTLKFGFGILQSLSMDFGFEMFDITNT